MSRFLLFYFFFFFFFLLFLFFPPPFIKGDNFCGPWVTFFLHNHIYQTKYMYIHCRHNQDSIILLQKGVLDYWYIAICLHSAIYSKGDNFVTKNDCFMDWQNHPKMGVCSSSKEFTLILQNMRGSAVAQRVKPWSSRPTFKPRSTNQGIFSTVNMVPLHTDFHYHPPKVLIWLKYCQKGRKITNHPSIKRWGNRGSKKENVSCFPWKWNDFSDYIETHRQPVVNGYYPLAIKFYILKTACLMAGGIITWKYGTICNINFVNTVSLGATLVSYSYLESIVATALLVLQVTGQGRSQTYTLLNKHFWDIKLHAYTLKRDTLTWKKLYPHFYKGKKLL